MPSTISPHCPACLVPPWDIDVPEGPDRIDDSSTAAIAASGLRDPARFMDSVDPSLAASYRAATLTILATLRTDRHIAWNEPGWEGVLKHGVHHFRQQTVQSVGSLIRSHIIQTNHPAKSVLIAFKMVSDFASLEGQVKPTRLPWD